MSDAANLIQQLLSMAGRQATASQTASQLSPSREQLVQVLKLDNSPVLKNEIVSLAASLIAQPKNGQAKLKTSLGEILVKWPSSLSAQNEAFTLRFKPELGLGRVTIQAVAGKAQGQPSGQGQSYAGMSTEDQANLRVSTSQQGEASLKVHTRAEIVRPTPQVPASLIHNGAVFSGQSLFLLPFTGFARSSLQPPLLIGASQLGLGSGVASPNEARPAGLSSFITRAASASEGISVGAMHIAGSLGQRLSIAPNALPLSQMQFTSGHSSKSLGFALSSSHSQGARGLAGAQGENISLLANASSKIAATIAFGDDQGGFIDRIDQNTPSLQRGYSIPRNMLVHVHASQPWGFASLSAPASLSGAAIRGSEAALSLPQYGVGRVSDVAQAGLLTGTVVGFTDQDLPVLALMRSGLQAQSMQYVVMPVKEAGLTMGSLITFGASEKAALHDIRSFMPLNDSVWPILEEVMEEELRLKTLTGTSEASASIFQSLTPQAQNPGQIAATTLFLMAALSAGSLSHWMGEPALARLRQAGMDSLLEKLGDDFSKLSRLYTEPSSQDWRMLSLPLLDQSVLTKANLFSRVFWEDVSDDPEQETRQKVTRFVVDLDMSRMGGVQIDGLVRPERLDVILRTEQSLSEDVRQYLRLRYQELLEEGIYKGDLSFQSDPKKMLVFQ